MIEQLRTVFLEMPYKGEEDSISMFIFLPVFHVGAIDELLENITPEILDEVFRGGLQREVDVEFPKISFERKFELVPVSTQNCTVFQFHMQLTHTQFVYQYSNSHFLLPEDFKTNGRRRFIREHCRS